MDIFFGNPKFYDKINRIYRLFYEKYNEPILQDIPTFIKTQRLLIRAYQSGDGAGINGAVIESQC